MSTERTLIAALVADMASAHDECLDGWHESARDTLLGAMQAGNAFLATPAETAAPFAWYSTRHGDTLTAQQKTERAAYLPLDAAAYSAPLFTGAPVAPTEWTDAKLRGIASDYFPDSVHWPAAMLCLRHLLMEQSKFGAPVAPAEPAEGWVLVPKRMTQEMRDVTDSEGWTWEELLAEAGSISQEEYAAIAAEPAAPAMVPPQSTQAVQMGLAACDAGGFVATTNAVLAVWRACEKFHGIKP